MQQGTLTACADTFATPCVASCSPSVCRDSSAETAISAMCRAGKSKYEEREGAFERMGDRGETRLPRSLLARCGMNEAPRIDWQEEVLSSDQIGPKGAATAQMMYSSLLWSDESAGLLPHDSCNVVQTISQQDEVSSAFTEPHHSSAALSSFGILAPPVAGRPVTLLSASHSLSGDGASVGRPPFKYALPYAAWPSVLSSFPTDEIIEGPQTENLRESLCTPQGSNSPLQMHETAEQFAQDFPNVIPGQHAYSVEQQIGSNIASSDALNFGCDLLVYDHDSFSPSLSAVASPNHALILSRACVGQQGISMKCCQRNKIFSTRVLDETIKDVSDEGNVSLCPCHSQAPLPCVTDVGQQMGHACLQCIVDPPGSIAQGGMADLKHELAVDMHSQSMQIQTGASINLVEQISRGSTRIIHSFQETGRSHGRQHESANEDHVRAGPYDRTETRYLCPNPECEKSYSTRSHAIRHSRIHATVPPFVCPHTGCRATFTRRDNCSQHQRTRHRSLRTALPNTGSKRDA